MEHIRQFDWCYSQPDIYFVKEVDLDHCVTERILRNKFHNPLVSSDSEEDKPAVDWDQVFSKSQNLDKVHRIFVPCLQPLPQYPKQSALTDQQHYQCIKVLCTQNMHVLEQEFVPRPTKSDYKVFEELKPIYEKEQKEYTEWAKTLWTTNHCVRALRPKPIIELLYEAIFKLKIHEMQSYPSNYKLAAQIPLETRNSSFDMVLEEDLINVDLKLLPKIDKISLTKKISIMKTCSIPEPCKKHPCRFILPNEKSVSILPLTGIHRELAQYALERGASCIASEEALRCFVEPQRVWDLAVAVHPAVAPDGEQVNILVLGDEFSFEKESPLIRTHTSFKHMLEQSVILPSEKFRHSLEEDIAEEGTNNTTIDMDVPSDDEHNGLCIDDAEIIELDSDLQDKSQVRTNSNGFRNSKEKRDHIDDDGDGDDGFEKCTCKDTIFRRAPRRSFRKWKITNKTSNESFSVVIHCIHRVQGKQGEVLLEPSAEYQLELGASEMSEGRLTSLALAMHLRKNATLAHFRINGCTGEIATIEHISAETFKQRHGGLMSDVTNCVHSAIAQLQGLLPGNYVLHHEPSHGANALLFAGGGAAGGGGGGLPRGVRGADDALQLSTPPAIGTAMLPYHKFRRMLPCAFTPHERQVRRGRAPPRCRTPPRALQVRCALRPRAGAVDLYAMLCSKFEFDRSVSMQIAFKIPGHGSSFKILELGTRFSGDLTQQDSVTFNSKSSLWTFS